MRMLAFSGIFRQDSHSVLLLSHFGWIITQLESRCWEITFHSDSLQCSCWHNL